MKANHTFTYPKLALISLENLDILVNNLETIRPIIIKYRNRLDENIMHDAKITNNLLDLIRIMILDCQKEIIRRKEICGLPL